MYPFDRFTETAKDTIRLAQADANRAGLGFVGAVHLLRALQAQPATAASQLIVRLHVDPTSIAPDEASSAPQSPHPSRFSRASGTFKNAIARAFEEAQKRGVETVGTADLLIGALSACGDVVTSAKIRDALPDLLAETRGHDET